ncbi:MAG TPA: SHOCT domain-containing protein [Candidatus Saccharimonadales bacterium]|nr:SHOCT domain-containing protein [Candidatus Saccharimonadales bacterium]
MPGLLRGMARTAVVAGTATAASNRVSRRQAQRWADQGQAQPGYMAPVETGAPAQDDTAAQLQQLAQLKDQGILTQEEFDAKKKQILGL